MMLEETVTFGSTVQQDPNRNKIHAWSDGVVSHLIKIVYVSNDKQFLIHNSLKQKGKSVCGKKKQEYSWRMLRRRPKNACQICLKRARLV